VGFVAEKAALVQVFSKYFRLPCYSFHRLFHTHLLQSIAGTTGHTVPYVPSGLSLNPQKEKVFYLHLNKVYSYTADIY
jgi:hypothetical protein